MRTIEKQLRETLHSIEEQFERKDAQFKEFFEIAPEGIMVLDCTTGRFSTCNANAVRLLKYSEEDLLTKGPIDLSPEFQPDGKCSAMLIEEIIGRVLNGEKLVFEWLSLDGLGKQFMGEVRLVLLTNGMKPEIYASFVDITERKAVERTLKYQNLKLKNIAFMQSHQVRGPLARIMGLIQLINLNEFDDPQNKGYLEKLGTLSQNLDDVIKTITVYTEQINHAGAPC